MLKTGQEKVISLVKNLIHKKYTSIIGWVGVILTVYKNIQSSRKYKKVVLAKSPDEPFFLGANTFPVNPAPSRLCPITNSGPIINSPRYRVAPKSVT